MLKKIFYFAVLASLLTSMLACKKLRKNRIYFAKVEKQFVFTRNVETLKSNTDDISEHIDSILSGLINVEFVSTGNRAIDITQDNINDVGFEIIDLNKFNINRLPVSFDSLATRVNPIKIQVLDNSTFGYADALDKDAIIDEKGNWENTSCVLGTFGDAGQFKGKGEKYLGIRIPSNKEYMYGWVKLYCSQHNDTLRIIEFAYNQTTDKAIKAGQK